MPHALLFALLGSSAMAHEWPEGKPLPSVERWHAPLAWPTTRWVVLCDVGDHDEGEPMAVGIENVGYLVGSVQDVAREDNPFGVRMMTPENQARERTSAHPVVCSAGQLTLDEASQGHAKGMLRVDLTRYLDGNDARRWPVRHGAARSAVWRQRPESRGALPAPRRG